MSLGWLLVLLIVFCCCFSTCGLNIFALVFRFSHSK